MIKDPDLIRQINADTNHMLGFFAEVQRLMVSYGHVLDLGCGSNQLIAAYRADCREVWGTDMVVHPELQHSDWFRLLGPKGEIPFDDNSFDVVTSMMVMEHVADPGFFFRELARVLKPGGCYIGHSINSSHYMTFVRRSLDLFPHTFTQKLVEQFYGRKSFDTFPTYYRCNTAKDITRYGRRYGLEPQQIRFYADYGYYELSEWLTRRALKLDRWLEGRRPGLGKIYFTAILRKH
jgi:SAM-dependent methyltransferase